MVLHSHDGTDPDYVPSVSLAAKLHLMLILTCAILFAINHLKGENTCTHRKMAKCKRTAEELSFYKRVGCIVSNSFELKRFCLQHKFHL